MKYALASGPLATVRQPAFLLALLSLVVFYAILRLMEHERQRRSHEARTPATAARTPPWAFWIHAPVYVLLNVVIGALVLQQAQEGWRAVLLFVTAKGSALLVLDHAFLDQHGARYERFGRWMTAVAIPIGAALRVWLVPLSDPGVTLLLAVLGGAVLVNMVGEEVRPDRDSHVTPFVTGSVSYVLLVSIFGPN